jgi:hypothetical protein
MTRYQDHEISGLLSAQCKQTKLKGLTSITTSSHVDTLQSHLFDECVSLCWSLSIESDEAAEEEGKIVSDKGLPGPSDN